MPGVVPGGGSRRALLYVAASERSRKSSPCQRLSEIRTLESLLVRVDRYLKIQQVLSDETRRESVERHRPILELIEHGQAANAVAVLREHIN